MIAKGICGTITFAKVSRQMTLGSRAFLFFDIYMVIVAVTFRGVSN